MKRNFSDLKIVFILIFICFLNAPVYGDWNRTVSAVEADVRAADAAMSETRQTVAQERARLQAELNALENETAALEGDAERMKGELDGLLQAGEELRQSVESGEEQTKRLEEILRTAAKDADELVRRGTLSPETANLLAPLLDPERFPGMKDIENLVSVLFQEMENGGKIVRYSGDFVRADGSTATGDIIRVGRFTAFFRNNDETGWLRYDPALGKMAALPGKPPWTMRRKLRACFDDENAPMPLDLSGGVILEQVNGENGLRHWIERGGFLVWPIFLIAIVAFFLALERVWTLSRMTTRTDALMDQVRELAHRGEWEQCLEICRKYPSSPTCRVLRAGLRHRGLDKAVLENALEESILKELPRLERFLTTLSVLAAIAPLLGLLGTVTGMIHTFQGITVFGTSDPRMMSGGISEALITTQLGLAVAVPVMIVHHFLDRRVEKIIADMEEKGTSLVTAIIRESA